MGEALDEILHYLREHGLRNTRARRRIVRSVLGTNDHFTADQLLERLHRGGANVSRASVYRTLALLVDGRFVESREFQRGHLMYELMKGRHHHDHLICDGCDEIIEFENDPIERLQEEVAESFGYTLEHHSLRLYGFCPKCREKNRS